jgi:benzoate membrane transport protein
MTLERPPAHPFDLRRLIGDCGGLHFGNALAGFLFSTSAPVAIILTVSQQGGLAEADIASWLFACYFVNGLISLIFCLAYRQPLVFFWTIPGSVLVGQALGHLSFAQVIGAYIAAGVLLLILGLSGWMRTVMNRLPMPIVMAMVAGVFLQFGLNLVFALRDGLLIAAPMVAIFLLLSVLPRLGRVMPPVIGALIVGVVAILVLGDFDLPQSSSFILARPTLYLPEFSGAAMVELVLPLAITVLAAQNAQGFVILESAGHKPPVNTVTVACGVGSVIAAFFGAVSSCLAGPVNAIISSTGEREQHYVAGVIVAVLSLLFGIFAPAITRFMLALPKVFIAAVAGLALLRVLERAFAISFGGTFTLGAVVCFLVTVANVPLFSIGAPFWAVLAGLAVSWLLERGDFKTLAAPPDARPTSPKP